MLLSALIFTPIFLLNLTHLRYRKIPLYSWGTVIAVFHLTLGALSFIFIPIAALLVFIIVEIVHSSMNENDKRSLEDRYIKENEVIEKKIIQARNEINKFRIIKSYTIENYAEFNSDLKKLENAGLWYSTRSGILTSIITNDSHFDKCCELLEVNPADKIEDSIDDNGDEINGIDNNQEEIKYKLLESTASNGDTNNPYNSPKV